MKFLRLFCMILCIGLLLIGCEKECTHQYQSQITLQASCIQEGEETFTCTICQHSYTQPVPVLEHCYGPAEIEKAATCAEEGTQSIRCTVCGATESTPIEKIPHILENITVIKEPNCTQEGEGCGDCTVCGAQQVTATIATNDVHVFTNTVIREATCKDVGEGINTCQLCQYSESCQYELKEHNYSMQNILTKVSCTKNGEVEHICANCGDSTIETVAAPGHSWSGATCMTAGVCSACGATGSKANHAYVILEDYTPSTHFAGYRVKKCSTCERQNSEYYTELYTYDLDAIAAEIAAYAEAKGFKPVIEEFHDYNRKIAYSVWELELPGYGPKRILQNAKSMVDSTYRDLTDFGAILGNRAMHIYVYYTQSGAVGSGFFGVYIKTSFYDLE